MNKNGFTLAEVLITLAIIGIVAALTIPGVITNYRATQYQTSLKKAHSQIEQALLKMRVDYGEAVNSQTFGTRGFKPVFMKYFSVIEDCKLSDCYNKATPKYRNYNNTADAGGSGTGTLFAEGNFVTKDGMLFMFDDDGSTYIIITVDINGYKKAPNRLGHDTFSFYIDSNGKLIPGGKPPAYSWTNTCDKNSSEMKNGTGCTYKALTDLNYFKNLP